MNETFLEKILAVTREKVDARRKVVDISELHDEVIAVRENREQFQLSKALSVSDRINIIAEIKRASPSKGIINDRIDVTETATAYKTGGASAISVLTEEQFFKGSLADLKDAREAVDLPILRKDFTVDEYQIYEAGAAGADAILLIVAALTSDVLSELQTLAHELGMDALVEAHTFEELETAASLGASLIGINNRNLRSLDVSLDVSRELIRHRPANAIMIAESGISSRDQINELKQLGFDGFLIGESLMRGAEVERLTGAFAQERP
jgi:indole-3-glycerol phosphate synthase